MAWCSLLLFQDFGTAGSPLPLGRLLPKVQEVARCLGELLTAACSGRVSVLEAPGAPLVLLLGAVPRRGLPDCVLPQAPPSSSLGPLGATSPSAPVWQQQTILMLKEQNRLLTQVRCGKMGLGLVALQTLTAPLPALPPRR